MKISTCFTISLRLGIGDVLPFGLNDNSYFLLASILFVGKAWSSKFIKVLLIEQCWREVEVWF